MKRYILFAVFLVGALALRAAASLPDGGITWQELRAQQILAANTLPDGGQKPNPYLHHLSDGGTFYGMVLPDGGIPARNPYNPPPKMICTIAAVMPDGGAVCPANQVLGAISINGFNVTTNLPRCCPAN